METEAKKQKNQNVAKASPEKTPIENIEKALKEHQAKADPFAGFSEEDKFEMQMYLNRKMALKKCWEEIDAVLEKYNARLIINPNSLVKEPQPMVILNN